MVEVGYLAQRTKISIRETLERPEGTPGSIPLPGGGGGNYLPAIAVRRVICDP